MKHFAVNVLLTASVVFLEEVSPAISSGDGRDFISHGFDGPLTSRPLLSPRAALLAERGAAPPSQPLSRVGHGPDPALLSGLSDAQVSVSSSVAAFVTSPNAERALSVPPTVGFLLPLARITSPAAAPPVPFPPTVSSPAVPIPQLPTAAAAVATAAA
jgi:hypothetical protein